MILLLISLFSFFFVVCEDSTRSGLVCPECNSDHVIQLIGQSAPSTSTPVHSDVEEGGEKRHFRFDDPDTPKRQPRVISVKYFSLSFVFLYFSSI